MLVTQLLYIFDASSNVYDMFGWYRQTASGIRNYDKSIPKKINESIFNKQPSLKSDKLSRRGPKNYDGDL